MKVNVFEAVTANGLEKQINAFLAQDGVKMREIKYRLTTSSHGVLITYEDNSP